MKLSDFLRWGLKKDEPETASQTAAVKDRRQVLRRIINGSGWVYWASESGEPRRTRMTFLDIGENSSGLGFVSAVEIPSGAACWALPDGGQPLACEIRHVDQIEEGYRVGGNLELPARFVTGAGATRVYWIDENRMVHSIPATVKNSGQALVEVGLPINVPARHMMLLEGPQYGCLAVCRGARPDGSRFILVAEAASDSFATGAVAA